MIISRKKFEAEIQKRVEEAICKTEEANWRNAREHEQNRHIEELKKRVIELEKKNGIDHPSHHCGDNCCAGW